MKLDSVGLAVHACATIILVEELPRKVTSPPVARINNTCVDSVPTWSFGISSLEHLYIGSQDLTLENTPWQILPLQALEVCPSGWCFHQHMRIGCLLDAF